MSKTLFISPMIPSFDMSKTIDFFRDVLGFLIEMQSATCAVLAKDNLTIHIMPAGADIGQMEFYMEVEDVDELWAVIKDKVKGLNFKEPFNQDYMMREIHIAVPQTNTLLFIGQSLT